MFKNALVYRIAEWEKPPLAEIEERLDKARFVECGATQLESVGWVEPRGEKHGPLVEAVGSHLMLRLASERRAVPASAVKDLLEARLDQVEAQTGRRPKGKQAKQLKEELVHELLPRAFPKRGSTWVWVDADAARVVVGAGSIKKADSLTTALVEALGGGIRLELAQTRTSPAVAMSRWLSEKEAPAGFTIDRECELKQPDSEKAAVKYSRHTLDIDEVGSHIEQGKVPTQLALTWADRVSFVLTDNFGIKKLKLLDVVLEGSEAKPDDKGFDADVAITTGEYAPLIAALIDALDGQPEAGEIPGVTPLASSPPDERLAA